MRMIPVLMVLAGCVGGSAVPHGASREQRALAEELAGRTAGNPRACVPIRQNQALQIIDRRTLVYREGDLIHVNRLDADCPGLRPANTLVIEAQGGRYCRGDRIRGVEPGSAVPGPSCTLREFTPYRPAG